MQTKDGSRSYEDEKFSYLIIRRGPRPEKMPLFDAAKSFSLNDEGDVVAIDYDSTTTMPSFTFDFF